PRGAPAALGRGGGGIRAVAVRPVAANELRARRDNRRADTARYAGCQPVFVTMPTRGCAPGTRTQRPTILIVRFSGVSICTHSRVPLIARAGSPLLIVPSNTTLPVA